MAVLQATSEHLPCPGTPRVCEAGALWCLDRVPATCHEEPKAGSVAVRALRGVLGHRLLCRSSYWPLWARPLCSGSPERQQSDHSGRSGHWSCSIQGVSELEEIGSKGSQSVPQCLEHGFEFWLQHLLCIHGTLPMLSEPRSVNATGRHQHRPVKRTGVLVSSWSCISASAQR